MFHTPCFPAARRTATAKTAVWLLLAALALAVGGCGQSATSPAPVSVVTRFTGLAGRQVTWSTNVPTRGAVRYGFVSGQYDHYALPTAAGGADKAYSQSHAVPLLDDLDGRTVFIQCVDVTPEGFFAAARETALTFAVVPATAPLLRFTTIDVQFGDAHVLRLPTAGRVVAIDGGDPGVNVHGETAPQHVMRWLDDRAISRLDVALATHMHADHVGGLLRDGAGGPGLLEHCQIGLYLDVPAVTGNAYNQVAVDAILAAREITKRIIAPGMTSAGEPEALDWDPGVEVMVLNAGAQPEWAGGDLNNDSVVLKISYGLVDLITGGDCLVLGETRILTNFPDALPGVEYFKVSHHGRSNANSLAYLQAMSPRAAVIPVAFVAYNEGPDQGAKDTAQTLERLGNLRTDVFRFDAAEPLARPQDNQTFWNTTFTTDGVSYEVRIEPSVWGL
ncbi:MAG: ComEC/Rec2 family competence protein [Candidatus Krumholzibacteriia bacterium]